MTASIDTEPRWTGLREVLTMAWPIVLGSLSFVVMTFVDVWFVSHLGGEALAAVGISGVWSYTINTLGIGVAACVGTFVAQSLGRGEPHNCGAYAWQGIYAALLSGVVAVAAWWLPDAIFPLMNHEPAVVELESIYFRVRLFGFVFIAWQAGLSAFFQAINRPVVPMYAAFIANLLNVALDYVLIFGAFGWEGWGIGGAAAATSISMAIQVVTLQVLFLAPNVDREYHTRRSYAVDMPKLRNLLRIGWPSSVMMFLDVLNWSVFTGFMVGRLGTVQMAAQTAALQYMHLSFIPSMGLSMAITPIVGHWIGRGDPKRAKARAYTTARIAMVYAFVVAVSLAIFGESLMGFFSEDPAVIKLGHTLLIMAALFSASDALCIVFSGALRGAGDTRWMMWATFIGAYMFSLPMAYTFSGPMGWGAVGAWLGATIYITMLSGVLFTRFHREGWRSIQIFKEDDRLAAVGIVSPPVEDALEAK